MTADPRDVLTRPAPVPQRTLRYGPGPQHLSDVVMPPAGLEVRPLVVFVHGGFWAAEFDRTHVRSLAAALAALGYPVACLEYRRIGQPGGGWPGTYEDVAAGAAAIPGLLDLPGPPILAGHSAGGHLALWAAARIPARGVLALAPVTDLPRSYELGLGDGAVQALLGGAPTDVPDRYAAAAEPVEPPVPTVLVHGDQDRQVPVELSRAYAARGDLRLVELPGVEHFGLIDPLASAWPAVLAALARC